MIKNCNVLITGGGSGIGAALALQLANDNRVVICGRKEENLKKVSSKNSNIIYEVVDVSDSGSIEKLFAVFKEKGIVFNVLFNNAGVVERWDLTERFLTTSEIFQKVNTNLSGAIAVIQQFIKQADHAAENLIVNNTSEIAIMPVPLLPLYSATKTGLSVFTRLLRVQLKNTKFRIIEILPPGVDTDMPKQLKNTAKLVSADDFASDVIKEITKGTIEYAPGKNVLMMKFFQKFLPDTGLNLIDKLSRRQLGG